MAPGIATRSKDATRGSWHRLRSTTNLNFFDSSQLKRCSAFSRAKSRSTALELVCFEDFKGTLLTALSILIAAVPIALPLVLQVTMAIGAYRMATATWHRPVGVVTGTEKP